MSITVPSEDHLFFSIDHQEAPLVASSMHFHILFSLSQWHRVVVNALHVHALEYLLT